MKRNLLFTLGILLVLILGCSSSSEQNHFVEKNETTTFTLLRGGANQFLLPVKIGSQTFNLLVDTGSNALLVFSDKIDPHNSVIEISETDVSKGYSSTLRSGRLAHAPVTIGSYHAPRMAIMVIDSPDSRNDPSLTAKRADGVIGLRRTDGLALNIDPVPLDVPLAALQPAVSAMELNLPPRGEATISFGHMPILDRANPSFVFRAKTLSIKDTVDSVNRSYSDLQVPFRARSSFGKATDPHLDILFDTGAVSKLVLDTGVAARLGYDVATRSWKVPSEEEIELNLIGPNDTITIEPKFKVSEIKVVPYSTMGVEFEAVLGIDRWQEYVVGFSFVDFQSGGPDGTISILARKDLDAALDYEPPIPSAAYVPLPGLNSLGDDRFPSTDDTGELIAFQSNRPGGRGGWDIYLYRQGEGLIDLSDTEVNTPFDDSWPSLSGDGRYLAFHSNRYGSYDIFLYDLEEREFVDTSALNTEYLERTPSLSRDGRYLAYRAERPGGEGKSDVYLYDLHERKHVPLPGLNTQANDWDPSVSEGGRYLTFHSDRYGDKDVFLFDISRGVMIDLPKGRHTDLREGVNTIFEEHTPRISADGRWIAFDTNRYQPEMGLFNRDILIVDTQTAMVVHHPGLNSAFDEIAPSFSGNGAHLAFHSSRPGGKGGSDVYLYRLAGSAGVAPPAASSPGDIPLHRTEDGLYAAEVMIGAQRVDQKIDLLIDTALTAVVLFADRLGPEHVIARNEAVTFTLQGEVFHGTIGVASLAVGPFEIAGARVVLIDSKELARLPGGIPEGVSGFFGLRYKRGAGDVYAPSEVTVPLAALNPPINMLELNLPAEGTANLSLGNMPLNSQAPESLRFSTFVAGVLDPVDPVHNSRTDLEPPVIAVNDRGDASMASYSTLLSTVLLDRLVIDETLARELGYRNGEWGEVSEITIYFAGISSILPLAQSYPVSKVTVADFAGSDYQAVLSLDRWYDFIVGFDFVDFQMGGPKGVVSFLHRKDAGASGTGTQLHPNFVPLPGLNSNADDSFGDICHRGELIVFQSNRNGGIFNIYAYRLGQGLLPLPGLNSPFSDTDPNISGDGRLIAFQSDRSGDWDIYLYDLEAQAFIDLPGLNTKYLERSPALNEDGTLLAFRSQRPQSVGGSSDIYIYSVEEKKLVPVTGAWFNTRAHEYDPSLALGGDLIGFHALDRDDGQGLRDVYLYDRRIGDLVELPWWVNSPYQDSAVALSPEGGYMAFSSERNNPQLGNQGRDIFLLELSSKEFLFLPGLNSTLEDSAPALTPGAREILFHSKRPGAGGYDIYLYRRN